MGEVDRRQGDREAGRREELVPLDEAVSGPQEYARASCPRFFFHPANPSGGEPRS